MLSNKHIEKLQIEVEELKDMVRTLSEKLDSRFTDIVTDLKEIQETISDQTNENHISEDELYVMALRVVEHTEKTSTSLLQRKLGIGYARASNLMDLLEAKGVIEEKQIGSLMRKVLKNEKCSR